MRNVGAGTVEVGLAVDDAATVDDAVGLCHGGSFRNTGSRGVDRGSCVVEEAAAVEMVPGVMAVTVGMETGRSGSWPR